MGTKISTCQNIVKFSDIASKLGGSYVNISDLTSGYSDGSGIMYDFSKYSFITNQGTIYKITTHPHHKPFVQIYNGNLKNIVDNIVFTNAIVIAFVYRGSKNPNFYCMPQK